MAEKYFGKYRGKVTAVDNSEGMLKIKADVPRLLDGFTTGWALPCLSFPFQKAKILFEVKVGDLVWIEFEQGLIDKPIWSGGWFKSDKEFDWHGIELDGTKLEWTEDGVIAHKDLVVKNDLKVDGDLEVKGNVTLTGNITVNGTLYYRSMVRME